MHGASRSRVPPAADFADEAVRLAREMIIKDNVDFLSGTLTSAEAPAVLDNR